MKRRALTLGGAEPITPIAEQSPEVDTRPLQWIKPRAAEPTRGIDPGHVVNLALSIHALGLLEPIVCDQHGNLLAGAHRLAACRVLAAGDNERGATLARSIETLSPVGWDPAGDWGESLTGVPSGCGALSALAVPVRVYAISADNPDAALHVEIAENEQRRDYTASEVRALWRRLESAEGYRTEPGRPRAGEIAATDVIATVIGKSRRTVQRMLADAPDKAPTDAATKEMRARNALRRAAAKYRDVSGDTELVQAADLIVQLIDSRR